MLGGGKGGNQSFQVIDVVSSTLRCYQFHSHELLKKTLVGFSVHGPYHMGLCRGQLAWVFAELYLMTNICLCFCRCRDVVCRCVGRSVKCLSISLQITVSKYSSCALFFFLFTCHYSELKILNVSKEHFKMHQSMKSPSWFSKLSI